jgi:hypothetical protein
MPRRVASSRQQDTGRHSTANEAVSSQNDAALDVDPHLENERQVREALAEYFAILREWSLSSRPTDVESDSHAGQS